MKELFEPLVRGGGGGGQQEAGWRLRQVFYLSGTMGITPAGGWSVLDTMRLSRIWIRSDLIGMRVEWRDLFHSVICLKDSGVLGTLPTTRGGGGGGGGVGGGCLASRCCCVWS